MMLTVYTLDDRAGWDAAVRSFGDYDVYWLSGYVEAFKLHGDGEPLLIHYDDGHVRGVNVVMRRDIACDERFEGKIPKDEWFDLATPYGYGGWLIEGGEAAPLFEAYTAWARKKGIVSEFVRFHPMLGNHVAADGFYNVIRLGEVVHMDLTSPELIWENINSKNRNMIRKAIKNGVCIYNSRCPEILRVFREIYNATMDKDHAEQYYYFDEAFYNSVLNDLKHNAQVFYAEKDGKVIAASIMIGANGHLNYHLSGSLREYNSVAPSNLMLYEAALWGQANGYKTLYLGGGVGSGEDSLLAFKKSFNKQSTGHFYIGKKTFDSERYVQLCALRGIKQAAFFPEYRSAETEGVTV